MAGGCPAGGRLSYFASAVYCQSVLFHFTPSDVIPETYDYQSHLFSCLFFPQPNQPIYFCAFGSHRCRPGTWIILSTGLLVCSSCYRMVLLVALYRDCLEVLAFGDSCHLVDAFPQKDGRAPLCPTQETGFWGQAVGARGGCVAYAKMLSPSRPLGPIFMCFISLFCYGSGRVGGVWVWYVLWCLGGAADLITLSLWGWNFNKMSAVWESSTVLSFSFVHLSDYISTDACGS